MENDLLFKDKFLFMNKMNYKLDAERSKAKSN